VVSGLLCPVISRNETPVIV